MPTAKEKAQLDFFMKHFIFNLQGKINKLSKRKNVYVVAIINCCRVILPATLSTMDADEGLNEQGSLTIGFACELGGQTTQSETE